MVLTAHRHRTTPCACCTRQCNPLLAAYHATLKATCTGDSQKLHASCLWFPAHAHPLSLLSTLFLNLARGRKARACRTLALFFSFRAPFLASVLRDTSCPAVLSRMACGAVLCYSPRPYPDTQDTPAFPFRSNWDTLCTRRIHRFAFV